MKITVAILLLSAFVFASCNSSTSTSTTTPTGGSGVPSSSNTMIVTFNGTTDTLVATAVDTTISGVKNIIVAGAGTAGIAVGFTLTNITATGSYSVGPISLNGISPYFATMDCVDKSGNTYLSPTPGAGVASVGTITITSITDTTIQATFNASPLTLRNGTTTVSLTNGGVYAKFY